MPISERILSEFEMEMANTRRLLECVPDAKLDYKPSQKSMRLGRLASHVAELVDMASALLSSEALDYQPYVARSRTELLESFDKSVAKVRESLQATNDEQLARDWISRVEGREVFCQPRATLFRSFFLSHLIHHRGQLTVYLRLNNIAIPGVYGPSADDLEAAKKKCRTVSSVSLP